MRPAAEIVPDAAHAGPGVPARRVAMGPSAGQNVPPGALRAMRGVLWSVTLLRVALIPVFLAGAVRAQALAEQGGDIGTLRAGLLFALTVMAASDFVDGWFSRRFGLATQAGAVGDALADKLLQAALVGFFALSSGPAFTSLPVWFFALVLGWDAVLGGGWLVLKARGSRYLVVHRFHGRAASVGVFVLLFWITAGLRADALVPLTMLTAALIWVSVAAYVGDAWKGKGEVA